ncbi:hypothetical protein IAT38_007181 [Cryptococcus sp. DSM 104549]
MKHGIKQRKLQRMPAHRMALLRNLVSALLHHETITTTVPKAKEAAKLAEKIITYGKKNTNQSKSRAMAYLMPPHHGPSSSSYTPTSANPKPIIKPLAYPTRASSRLDSDEINPDEFIPPNSILPKLFTTLAERYAERPGGYTRVQRYGRRPGDNAPMAIVSLVDGPRDLKFEMAARKVGREDSERKALHLAGKLPRRVEGANPWASLSEKTRQEVEKVLKFRSEEETQLFRAKAIDYSHLLQAESSSHHHLFRTAVTDHLPKNRMPNGTTKPMMGRRVLAGERLPGMPVAHTGLGLARGDLGRQRGEPLDRTHKFLHRHLQIHLKDSEPADVAQVD